MRRTIVSAVVLMFVGVILGGMAFRQQVAYASAVLSVLVTNDAAHPVPVREQNFDANANIKVHEQGTANVNVTNSSILVRTPAVTDDSIVSGARIHAAAEQGRREYSRSSPPSLRRHLIAPSGLTRLSPRFGG